MDQYDVAVIGAGPAGSMAARYASRGGAATVLLEEHQASGSPVQCAGLLGIKALEASEISPGKYMLRPFSGARIFSPGGATISFQAPSIKAWVVERRLFDREMAIEAVRSGVELRLNSPATSLKFEGGRNIITVGRGHDKRDISAAAVISAEGVKARLARLRGLPSPPRVLSGAQAEVPFAVDDPDKVELHLGCAPGLFAWVIPTSESSARIGLCSEDNACPRLRSFLDSPLVRPRIGGTPVDLVFGGLPLGLPEKTVSDGIIAVGDAAGQVKPTSGGGIYPGIICAKIAGSVAARAALEGDCSTGRLSEYERRFRAAIGRELKVGMRLNRAMASMTDGDLDGIVTYLSGRPDLLRLVEERGDIDRPSIVLARMLPRLGLGGIRLAGILAGALFGQA